MLTAKEVALFLVDSAVEEDFIDRLKLQKLLYFAQAWSLALLDRQLFDDEIVAWPLGPVVSDVYYNMKENGKYDKVNLPEEPDYDKYTDEEVELLSDLLVYYKDYSGIEMVNLTHLKGTPWHKIYHSENGGAGSVIPISKIKEHAIENKEYYRLVPNEFKLPESCGSE